MNLLPPRDREAVDLEEAMLRARDGLADAGLRLVLANVPTRISRSGPVVLTLYVEAPIHPAADIGGDATIAALRALETTPYRAEPLPVPTTPDHDSRRKAGANAGTSASGAACGTSTDCAEEASASQEATCADGYVMDPAERKAFLAVAFPHEQVASPEPSNDESPKRQRDYVDADVGTPFSSPTDSSSVGTDQEGRREAVDRLASEVRAVLSRIDAKRGVKRRRLAKEREDRDWAAWCALDHSEKERLFAAKYHKQRRK